MVGSWNLYQKHSWKRDDNRSCHQLGHVAGVYFIDQGIFFVEVSKNEKWRYNELL